VILFHECIKALQIINPDIPTVKLEEVIRLVKNTAGANTLSKNKVFYYQLLDGIKVEFERKGHKIEDLVYLIDFKTHKNNRFLVVNQFAIVGEKHDRKPDIVVFINGFPISVVELKNPADKETDIWDAYNQLQTYKQDIEDLLHFNEALVISDGITARIGSLTANKERFVPWRTINNEDDRPLVEFELENVIKGFFQPELFLDYLRHFILYENDENKFVKKIAAYHLHAVREAVKATIIAVNIPLLDVLSEPRANYASEIVPGCKKAGVIWHTQGSGKSISMVCYAGKLLQQPQMQNPTIVVVTDRSDLDGQLFKTFSQAADLLKQTPVQADCRDDLHDMLESKKSGGIIFTTVQKFSLLNSETRHPLLTNRQNIVVISDEAHRSQYGDKPKLDTKTGIYKYGFSQHTCDALGNATFIGLTGTPITFVDKDTQKVFGDYISIYDIQDAVDDGATVPSIMKIVWQSWISIRRRLMH
jgi:type I restriction enzyme R subunit